MWLGFGWLKSLLRTARRSRWRGVFLSEDEIVNDLLKRILEQPNGRKIWLDPASWRLPMSVDGRMAEDTPAHAGSLLFVGMSIRNYYGLWEPTNPYTRTSGPALQIKNGIITDPLFPDNLSGRVIDRVRAALKRGA